MNTWTIFVNNGGPWNQKVDIDYDYAISKVWHAFLLYILQKTTVLLNKGE